MKKKMTLAQFTKKHGDQEKAAAAIGVDASTYSRWINRETRPRGRMTIRRFAELGVEVPK